MELNLPLHTFGRMKFRLASQAGLFNTMLQCLIKLNIHKQEALLVRAQAGPVLIYEGANVISPLEVTVLSRGRQLKVVQSQTDDLQPETTRVLVSIEAKGHPCSRLV